LPARNEERGEERPLLIAQVGRIGLGFHPKHMGGAPAQPRPIHAH
jgi:hypothetical protein